MAYEIWYQKHGVQCFVFAGYLSAYIINTAILTV